MATKLYQVPVTEMLTVRTQVIMQTTQESGQLVQSDPENPHYPGSGEPNTFD